MYMQFLVLCVISLTDADYYDDFRPDSLNLDFDSIYEGKEIKSKFLFF